MLAVEDHGDPAGWPVLVHNGTPSSRMAAFYGPWVADAVERGLRLISYDRPGYGESSPRQGRTVADTAADVRAICAELSIDRLVTWGFSGGGPHALACAALLPDLVAAAASLASLAPFDAVGLDWMAGMNRDDVDFTRLFLTDETAARRKLDEDRAKILAPPPEDVAGDGEPADAALHLRAREFRDFMRPCTRAGLATGSQGWWDDNGMQLRPWGFDLADIAVPILLLHGRQDMFVPPSHCQWLARHIPGVEAWLLDDYGHGTLALDRVPDVHAWLSEHR